MSGERSVQRTCTKEHPFVPPLKDDEWWIHEGAYETHPELDFSLVEFQCPNCGLVFELDLS